jgi:hypothetical protein
MVSLLAEEGLSRLLRSIVSATTALTVEESGEGENRGPEKWCDCGRAVGGRGVAGGSGKAASADEVYDNGGWMAWEKEKEKGSL